MSIKQLPTGKAFCHYFAVAVVALTLGACGGGGGTNSDSSASSVESGSSPDSTPPVLTLLGTNPVTVEAGATYIDPGATAWDNVDGDLTSNIITDTSAVNTALAGNYTVTYDVSDAAGNVATQASRTVMVADSTPPVVSDSAPPIITLLGTNPVTLEAGTSYSDAGATASDNVDGDLTANIVTDTSAVNTAVAGSYTVTYDVSDAAGNPATQVTRTVIVADTTPPVITLVGTNPVTVDAGTSYSDAGATASDTVDGDLTASIVSNTSAVNTAVAGSYTVTYDVFDAAGNAAAQVTRVVNVVPSAPTNVTLIVAPKQLQFAWDASAGADHYRILENLDGASGFSVVPAAAIITSTSHTLEIPVHKTNWLSAEYTVEACDAAETACVSSPNQTLTPIDSIAATLYVKASNTGTGDQFGVSVALSGDGNTLAVGAYYEASAATGIDGNQADDTAPNAGAVYVYRRSGATWSQQAYVKASNTGTGDNFGGSVALSNDGNTLAVGAINEASITTGIGGDESNNSASGAGAVYVFSRSGTTWSQQVYVKASNTSKTGSGDSFGGSVALSGDGNTLAVGARLEDSAATGIDGNQLDESADGAGAVYVYSRSGATWSQQAYVKASNTGTGDDFGWVVAISGDGNTLAVGARHEDSAATGIDGDQSDNFAGEAGAVYVYSRSGAVWSQQAYVKASNTESLDNFGRSVALSGDGNTLAAAARLEDSAATGIDGDQADNSVDNAGAVYVYDRTGSVWSQQAYIKTSNPEVNDQLGWSVALSSDGNTLAAGGIGEDSAARGIDGDQSDNSAGEAGAVYVYSRTGAVWSQQSYVKASNTEANDRFGRAAALSGDGKTLAVGARLEDSGTTGIDGDQSDNSAGEAGAVYVF